MKTKLPFPEARILTESELVAPGDFAKWSNSPRDLWIEQKSGCRTVGLAVATVRIRSGQPEMQFATTRPL